MLLSMFLSNNSRRAERVMQNTGNTTLNEWQSLSFQI